MIRRMLIFALIALSISIFVIVFFAQKDIKNVSTIVASKGKANSFAVYTEDGDVIFTDKSDAIKNPIGIVENPPEESITSIKEIVLESLNKDNKVLLIYIDGLGYELYEKAINSGNLPYISSLKKGTKALTVYPPITDVTFAAMVTGETPKYSGIHDREKKSLLADTIFDIASKEGKKSKIIEGNIRIIVDEVETVLNIDDNKNGTIDDEIYKSAMKEIQNPSDILLVHFHSYDDMGHRYGPNSREALNQLGVLDSYIEGMVEGFSGDLIITSDHGMHDDGGEGKHGSFSSSDMFIPIILK